MKLGRFAILMIGITLAVAALSWAFFIKAIPNGKEVSYLDKNTEANKTEADKMPQANKRVQTAKDMVEKTARKWQEVPLRVKVRPSAWPAPRWITVPSV